MGDGHNRIIIMACGCGNNSGGESNPYGGGLPTNPNAPTRSECVADTTDPCAVKGQQQTTPCPNGVCDERFQNLPPSKRVRILGASGNCLYQFPNHSNGFVMSDSRGQFVTERPCVNIPFLKEYLRNPDTGAIITDGNGDPIEDATPPVNSIIGVDEGGCQNRIQGISGKRQRQIWDGEQFKFVDDIAQDENPLMDADDIPILDSPECSTLIAALIPASQEAVGSCGEKETVHGFKIGGIRNVGLAIGIMHMWPGASDNIPPGYMLADGTSLSITEWPDLFAELGYSWGGSGNSFNLPDMRGLVPRGVDIDAGRDPDKLTRTAINTGGNTGNNVGSYQADQMQCFKMEYTLTTVTGETITTTGGPSRTVGNDVGTYTETGAIISEGDCGVPRFGEETRMKNAYVNFIVYSGCAAT